MKPLFKLHLIARPPSVILVASQAHIAFCPLLNNGRAQNQGDNMRLSNRSYKVPTSIIAT